MSVSIYVYDIAFFVLFTLITIIFLYIRRSNLQRQGWLYLYRTKIGVKLIDSVAKKYPKTLKALQYVVVASGYILMILIIWMLVKFTYNYFAIPGLAKELKVPILTPLIPYLPELFKLDFLPHFYFTYWIIIIAVIAIPHEFAHGIFARLNKIKVHSTGFGFLGPFLAAFVEPDEKQMAKAKRFPQLAILASGTFANVLLTLLFAGILWIFFITAFTPAGVYFSSYSSSVVNISEANVIGNTSILNVQFMELKYHNASYFAQPQVIELAKTNHVELINAFDNSPALKNQLAGAITEINGRKTTTIEELRQAINATHPGDTVTVKTIDNEKVKTYQITMDQRNGAAYLGIGLASGRNSGLLTVFYATLTGIRDPYTYYSSSLGTFGVFLKDLIWWLVVINLSVALVNMLPVGIFDGGRFFYLTVEGITGSKKIAERAFKASTWILLALVIVLMLKWVVAII